MHREQSLLRKQNALPCITTLLEAAQLEAVANQMVLMVLHYRCAWHGGAGIWCGAATGCCRLAAQL